MCTYMYTYTYMHMYMCLASLRSAFRAHPIGYPPRTVLIEPVVKKRKTGLWPQPKDAEKLCSLGPSSEALPCISGTARTVPNWTLLLASGFEPSCHRHSKKTHFCVCHLAFEMTLGVGWRPSPALVTFIALAHHPKYFPVIGFTKHH